MRSLGFTHAVAGIVAGIVAGFFAALGASLALAETTVAPVFTSVYTDLKRDCRNALKAVHAGQDMPLVCGGPNGYRLRIGYSAFAAHMRAETADGHFARELAAQPGDYVAGGAKIEWRLADGAPFAAIVRVGRYRAVTEGGDPFDPRNRYGEALVIKGLKGFERIDAMVGADGKTNANARARTIADAGYRK